MPSETEGGKSFFIVFMNTDLSFIIRLRIHVGMDEMYEKFKNLLMLLWKTGCIGCL